MYEDRPGYPGHNTALEGNYSPRGSRNEYQMGSYWTLRYPKGRGRTDKSPEPHISMLQTTGRGGGSRAVDVSLANLLLRWEIGVSVFPEGTPYRSIPGYPDAYGFMGLGEYQTVRVGELPGLSERLIERAAGAETPRWMR